MSGYRGNCERGTEMNRRVSVVPVVAVLLVAYYLAVSATRRYRLGGPPFQPTWIVGEDGRRLAGFFDGLLPDRKFELKRMRAALKEAQNAGCRGEGSSGILKRVRDFIDPTAHAQSNCSATACSGSYRVAEEIRPCDPPACPGGYTNTFSDPLRGNISDGFRQTATEGCGRDAQQYPYQVCACNQAICDTGYRECTTNSQCAEGKYCDNGTCQDSPCFSAFYCKTSYDCDGWPCESGCCAPPPCTNPPPGRCTMPYQIDPSCLYAIGTEPGCPPEYEKQGDCCVYLNSPIVIDLDGDGFALTSNQDGVSFDILNTGTPMRVSWTAAGSNDAWLVLDRNRNGYIDNGTELFGNRTPQPSGPEPNGFLALAVYDAHENGGNSDGMLSAADRIWAELRLWRDTNHNGISEFGELATLAASGIAALDLKYKPSKWVDAYGNEFRYRAKVIKPGDIGRWAYDVFLIVDER